jgi:hypothetical protein
MLQQNNEIETIINNKFMKHKPRTGAVYETSEPNVDYIDDMLISPSKTLEHIHDYTYINDDTLNKDIDDIITSDSELNYVIYSIEHDHIVPYVKFLTCKSSDIIQFPREQYHSEDEDDSMGSSSDDDSVSNIMPYVDGESDTNDIDISTIEENMNGGGEVYLPNQCYEYLETNFKLSDEMINKNYKGFISVENNVYIFICISDTNIKLNKEIDYYWAIIDEIINMKSINNIPICDKIINVFHSNKEIQNIHDENNVPIEMPIVGYTCTINKNGYSNITLSSVLTKSLITRTIEHDIFGDTLILSRIPLTSERNNMERLCLFSKGAIYIFHSEFTVREIKKIDNTSCICFIQDNIEMWSVKDIRLYSYI